MMFDFGATVGIGSPEAALLESEKNKLREPLERIIKRMNSKSIKQFQAFTDPLAIAFGMSFWAMRVIPLIQDKNKRDAENNANPSNSTYTQTHASNSKSTATNSVNGSKAHASGLNSILK